MTSQLTILYDACVLYPAPLRDLLVQIATSDICKARWTNLILQLCILMNSLLA